ncbi:MAG: ChaN family lipoprotein [Rhizobiales bacterium]|nr:ChaN family lipoprotein [Hyphomicrobiales bacterium]
MRYSLTLLLAFATWASAFSTYAMERALSPWQDWQTTLALESPLVGQIWSVRDTRLVSPGFLAEKAADARFVLIGETHDNADHHRLQAWLIGNIAQQRKPAVVMEMITADQAPKLAQYLDQADATAAGLGAAIDWGKSGWPDWSTYQPIAEAAIEANLALVAGSATRSRASDISRGGLKILETSERQRLALDQDLSPELDQALLEDIRQSHCGLLPNEALPAMTQVQRYRDAVLGDALIKAGAVNNGAVLIAGNGHARADRGVPWYLARLAAGASVVTVMLLEADEDAVLPADYLVVAPDGTPVADFFWFTPRAAREDPCEMMRRQFGQ